MGVLLKRWFLVLIIVGPAVILPGASAVDPRDYEESIKEDSVVEREDGHRESSTEYPNGVNVIPGDADTHYPIYAKIQKSSFSCAGRIPGFYADTELRCQVWHICDESGVQQSFLCTNGTTYSQDKRVCDWWYNVNCDAEEVNRQYAANEELYKGPPPKDGASYEETPNNDLPPVQQKRPVQQNQPQQRPQQQQQQQRHQTYDEPQNQRQQNYEEPQQRPQHSQHGNRPQSYDQSQQRPQRPQNHEEPRSQQEQRPQQSERPQNYEQPQQQQHQRPNNQQQQQRQQNYVKPQQQQRPQQQDNFDPPQQARKQPPSSPQNNNYAALPQPQPPQRPAGSPPASGTPEKKRVIVLRLPGPLPPGATIPPHLLMEYAESVLAAEREGKPPPAGLVSSKTVFLDNNTQRPQHTPTPPQQQRTQPPQQHRPHQPTPQQQRAQPPPHRPQEPQQQQAPEQQAATPRTRPAPKGPIVPYTPRPFSAFLEAASKYNGQTKAQPQQSQQSQQSQPQQQRPHQQQQQAEAQRRQPPPSLSQQQQQQQQQRRYEEPRQTPAPQTAYEEPREPHYRPQQQSHQEEQRRPHPPTTAAPPPEKKAPVPNYKPSKSPPPPPADFKKYRHSIRRNHGETKFAPKSAVAYEDLEEERQVIEESRRPAYFNNFQAVAHVAHTAAPTHSEPQQPQQRPVKTDAHLKSSFEPVLEKERPRQKVKYQEPTTTTERYLTHEEIIEPAIKRLVVAAGLKIKDPRYKQLTTPTPSRSEFNSEEQHRQDRNYEPARVIVARKSTTTFAPTTYYTNPTTTTTTTTTVAPQYYETTQGPSHPPTRRIIRKKLRVQTAQHHQSENFYSTPAPTQQRPQEPEFQEPEQPVTPRQRPAPKGPMLHYTPRPFSAFLAEASKFNGQTKSNPNTEAQEQRPKPTTPPQAYNEQEQRPAQQQQQKKRPNPPPEAFFQQAVKQVQQKQHRPVQQTQRPATYAPTTTYRAPTTTTTTTTPYPYDDYYSGEPTKATKNFGFDVYGSSDNEDEEEELARAAQEYYQASEFYGVKKRS